MTEVKPTVFVIDDDASVCKSLSRLLRSLGFEAETFVSAELFLEHKHYDGVGCIILDVRMPGLSGMDLQEELNKADYHMPIIFIKMCQNTPQLCWGDEWPPLSPGGKGLGGNDLIITPTLILPHQGGGKSFGELDAPQLCCGVLHYRLRRYPHKRPGHEKRCCRFSYQTL